VYKSAAIPPEILINLMIATKDETCYAIEVLKRA
jgi:hypothetical protein